VYWYVDGTFTTSRYYADALPDWVTRYNARQGAQRLAGASWTPLLAADRYAEVDSMPFENNGADFVFPHRFPTSPEEVARDLPNYPWIDSLTLDLALEGVSAIQLGQRGRHRLAHHLALGNRRGWATTSDPIRGSCTTCLLRLDHWLGWFMDSLAVLVPSSQTDFVLTADHGVQSFPNGPRMSGMRPPAGFGWLTWPAKPRPPCGDASAPTFDSSSTTAC
jgi:hypothetical protein